MHEDKIRSHMTVACSNGERIGQVDQIEGGQIKLTKDNSGEHHYIPMNWVAKVDDKVHLDRAGDSVRQGWKTAVSPER